ncbi:Proline/betaine transporter (Proline porter II) (PPII) [Durusdinium trenchii]|uniref:Proline/betaine transporter (Proline porter II) (PPII) n=1 Tax=Durusdinium trenchii TaxID=1381693 RepID=A0ABP0J2Q3_9DINO
MILQSVPTEDYDEENTLVTEEPKPRPKKLSRKHRRISASDHRTSEEDEVSWKLVALGICCCLGVVATGASLAVLSRLGTDQGGAHGTLEDGTVPQRPLLAIFGLRLVETSEALPSDNAVAWLATQFLRARSERGSAAPNPAAGAVPPGSAHFRPVEAAPALLPDGSLVQSWRPSRRLSAGSGGGTAPTARRTPLRAVAVGPISEILQAALGRGVTPTETVEQFGGAKPRRSRSRLQGPLCIFLRAWAGKTLGDMFVARFAAVILGNVLEWYDWTVFGYMQDIMKHVFGSGSGEQAWLLFAVPFLARPLGSVLFGWIGDACGHAVSLKLAIWGMAICTVLQGCLVPDSPGVTAQLAVLRIFTGLSAGGESAGVNTYMSEIGDEGREHTLGAAIGVNNLSGSLAFLLANLVSLLVHLLPWEDQVAWGWRVPFLLAAPLGVASILLRRHVPETEAFRRRRDAEKSETSSDAVEISSSESEQPSSDEPKRVPARWGPWTSHFYLLPLVVLVLSAVNSCNYLPIYLVSWLEEEAQLTPPQALSISALAKVVQMLMTFPASFATDLFGTTKVMLLGGSSVAVAAVPLLWRLGFSQRIRMRRRRDDVFQRYL